MSFQSTIKSTELYLIQRLNVIITIDIIISSIVFTIVIMNTIKKRKHLVILRTGILSIL